MKKKLGIALLVGTAVFGAVFGMAASLGLTSQSLGADQAVVASCDDAVALTYGTAYSTDQYKVNAINLTGLKAACAGGAFKVTPGDSAKALLGTEITGTLSTLTTAGGDAQSYAISLSTPVSAKLLENLAVVITK